MRQISLAILLALWLPGEAPAAVSSAPSDDPSHSCVMIQSTRRMPNGGEASGTGTGFLVDKDLVLTCNHLLHIPTPFGVVEAQRVKVQVGAGKLIAATVEKRDIDTDLALLKLERPVGAKHQPLYISNWTLDRRTSLKIIGNFPDRIRTTKGRLIDGNRPYGFAVASAKVYSGFSGGPILDEEGVVHGILSQRDDNHNSIFVRSDVVLRFLGEYARQHTRNIACFEQPGSRSTEEPMIARLPEEETTDRSADERVQAQRPKTSGAGQPSTSPEFEEVVVALPMRPSSGTFVSSNSTKKP